MNKDEAMQQALKLIERLNLHGWILADFEDEVYATLNSLKAALEQPDRRALQAEGKHPAPCARHCESKAFEIEIRSLKSSLLAMWTERTLKQPPLPVQEPVKQVSPAEFIQLTKGKETVTGFPVYWAEWLSKEQP